MQVPFEVGAVPRRGALPLLFGLLLLAALVSAIAQFGELERFLALVRHVEPVWLLACLLLQLGTYLCEAQAWRQALRRQRIVLPLSALMSLSVAKLFSDQALPSAGLSGSVFVVAALRRRGIGPGAALDCMLASLAAHFAAYAALSAASLVVLASQDELSRWLLVLSGAFMVFQLAVALAVGQIRRHGRLPGQALLLRSRRMRAWLDMLREASAPLPGRPALLLRLAMPYGAIMLLDAATLWLMLRALGTTVPPGLAFSSFMTASMVMSLSPIPLGLGTFEASCVAMLHLAGAGLEAALAATILLRGLTTWLPMIPGVWLVRREMVRGAALPH